MIGRLLMLSVAAAVGCLARYGLQGVTEPATSEFPFGVLVVNALGCLAFGVVSALFYDRHLITGETKMLVMTGLLGSFTTYSAVIGDTSRLATTHNGVLAVANIGFELLCGFGAYAIGYGITLWLA